MAERAKGVYNLDVTFGRLKTLRGHWLDRIPSFDEDIADLERRLKVPVKIENMPDPAIIEKVLKIANARPARPIVSVQHTPASRFSRGKPLPVRLVVNSGKPLRVIMHYRPVNQAEHWKTQELKLNSNTWEGAIPSGYTVRRFALQYYFEVQTSLSEATLIPALAANLDNVPYYVIRRDT